MDPFSLAMMAIGAVKSGVSMYKEAKSVGKEVFGIYTELSDSLGSFFDHQEKAHKYDGIQGLKDKAKYEQAQKKRMNKRLTESQQKEKNGILELQYVLQSWWFSSQLLD